MSKLRIDLADLLADLLALIGLASLTTGLWWIYPAVALIVLGLALIGAGVMLAWSRN